MASTRSTRGEVVEVHVVAVLMRKHVDFEKISSKPLFASAGLCVLNAHEGCWSATPLNPCRTIK